MMAHTMLSSGLTDYRMSHVWDTWAALQALTRGDGSGLRICANGCVIVVHTEVLPDAALSCMLLRSLHCWFSTDALLGACMGCLGKNVMLCKHLQLLTRTTYTIDIIAILESF
jgi:hypothetical protein